MTVFCAKGKNGQIISPDPVNVKFYFLFLIKEKNNNKRKKDYDAISQEARELLKKHFIESDNNYRETSETSISDHQSWYILENTSGENSVQIKHYKMRIILEIQMTVYETDLGKIFSKAKDKRHEFNELKQISEIFNSNEHRNDLVYIDSVFNYLLIEVQKDFVSKDYKSIEDEAITTFFYVVPDYRRKTQRIQIIKNLFAGPLQVFRNIKNNLNSGPLHVLKIIMKSLFTEPFHVPQAIIRLSRPSVITSKMSPFLRAEIINILYDKCLYELRKYEDLPTDSDISNVEITEETFRNMKEYLGKILFDTEMSISTAEFNRSIKVLSIIMVLGAFSAIISMMCVPNLFVMLFGLILLICAVWMLVAVLM